MTTVIAKACLEPYMLNPYQRHSTPAERADDALTTRILDGIIDCDGAATQRLITLLPPLASQGPLEDCFRSRPGMDAAAPLARRPTKAFRRGDDAQEGRKWDRCIQPPTRSSICCGALGAFLSLGCSHDSKPAVVATEIAQIAADLQADLVVVGTHGRRGLACVRACWSARWRKVSFGSRRAPCSW